MSNGRYDTRRSQIYDRALDPGAHQIRADIGSGIGDEPLQSVRPDRDCGDGGIKIQPFTDHRLQVSDTGATCEHEQPRFPGRMEIPERIRRQIHQFQHEVGADEEQRPGFG